MKTRNLLLDIDAYAASHFNQIPANTHTLVAYGGPRKGLGTLFIGMQVILQAWNENRITMEDVDEAEEYYTAAGLPFNREGFEIIVKDHGGKWPVKVLAVPEGTVIPAGVPAYVLWNLDERVPWTATFFENQLLRAWYPSTVASKSYRIKNYLREAMKISCDTLDKLPFMLHDFGSRGTETPESAAIGGFGHLAQFMGSDTWAANALAVKVYGAKLDSKAFLSPSYSIPAMAHLTVTSWGEQYETLAYDNMITTYGKEGKLLACVIDSTDADYAADYRFGVELKEKIIVSGAKVVLRHDSGDPLVELPKLLDILDKNFGSDVNSKGYKVLRNVATLWGDGIDEEPIKEIVDAVHKAGYSLDNLAFGMGGALLQKVNRDDDGWAQKASKIYLVDGTSYGVSKKPKTDPGKKSLEGTPVAYRKPDGSLGVCDMADARDNLAMKVVWDGEQKEPMVNKITLDEIRTNTGNW